MYYKNVRRLADGRRVSQFIDAGDFHRLKMLEYRPNGITKAPDDSNGVYCYDNLNSAKECVNGNTRSSFTGTVEVHVAYPIGGGTAVAFGTAFPTIRLGRTVARYKVCRGETRGWEGYHCV